MDIFFKGRRTEVQERFRKYATAKLGRIGKLDSKATRVDVEVSAERNPRQSDRRERVELTIRSRGPAIRAEAAADERFAAFDRAYARLEERLRRTSDRRKAARHGTSQPGRIPGLRTLADVAGIAVARVTGTPAADPEAGQAPDVELPGPAGPAARRGGGNGARPADEATPDAARWQSPDGSHDLAGVVPIQMEGDGPVVVREKFHPASPMAVDQALLEMELVGHDFYLFRDQQCGLPSVVYRRHGYQYGLIRLVEQGTPTDRGVAVRGAGRA
jgi:ribosomal subunit interface protein